MLCSYNYHALFKTDIKLPDSPREEQSITPPPAYEKYMQSQKVNFVVPDRKTENACGSLDPDTVDVNGSVPAHQNGVTVNGHLSELVVRVVRLHSSSLRGICSYTIHFWRWLSVSVRYHTLISLGVHAQQGIQ